LDADDVAFRLVPRLNAAGRMDHASMALQLLMTDNIATARQLAQSLNGLNDRRQEQEKVVLNDIFSDFQHHPERLKKRTLVCCDSKWHQGVLGIVASRITETYFRPVVLIAMRDNLGKGSARSIPGVDLFSALKSCQHCLEDFGGHSMAAGLSIRVEKLREFQDAFEKAVTQMTGPEDWIPKLNIDAEIQLADITENLIDEIEKLSPFGTGNPEPVFASRNVKVVSSKMVGKNHRKMALVQDANPDAKPVFAIRFNAEGPMQTQTSFARIAFRLRWNRWNNNRALQLIVEDAV
jgi:single-stranded-DNA-specific exonuclease